MIEKQNKHRIERARWSNINPDPLAGSRPNAKSYHNPHILHTATEWGKEDKQKQKNAGKIVVWAKENEDENGMTF